MTQLWQKAATLMTGLEALAGAGIAATLTAVYWAYDKITTHDRQIAVLVANDANIQTALTNVHAEIAASRAESKSDAERIEKAVTHQAGICQQVLLRQAYKHFGTDLTGRE